MSTFSARSLSNLSECHESLQKIATLAIQICDFAITTGHRGKDDQQKAFEEGKSKLQYPESKHNLEPSEAIDFQPSPFDWSSLSDKANPKEREKQLCRIYYIAGILRGIAHSSGIGVRSGADFNADGNPANDAFADPCHLELKSTGLEVPLP